MDRHGGPARRTPLRTPWSIAATVAALVPTGLAAQDLDVGRDIPIAIAVPPQVESEYGGSVSSLLESRLTQMVSGSGMAAVEGAANIVMYPLILVIDEERTGGLINDLTIVRLEVTMLVKNVADGTVFASATQELTGSGQSRESAVRNGIRDLDVRDSSVAAFARDARGAIVGHYERNCDAIIAESEALARTGNVEEALARLFAVPVDAGGCHGRTSDEVVRLYDANESRICEAQLQRARAELAVDRFAEAVAALGAVRRAGPCGDQVDGLIGELEREVREQDEAWFEAELERYQAFTDTIGDGIRANQGEAAANQERSRRMAESLAEQTFNKPEALAVSADFWTVSRS